MSHTQHIYFLSLVQHFNGKAYVPDLLDLHRHIIALFHDSKITSHPGRWKTWVSILELLVAPDVSVHREVHLYLWPLSLDQNTEAPPSQRAPSPPNPGHALGHHQHGLHCWTSPVYGTSWASPENCVQLWTAVHSRVHPQELYQMLGIRLAATKAYHPQGNSQTEWVNQELEQYLKIFVNQQQENWTDLLPLTEFQHSNHVHSSTQHPLFLQETGQLPHMGFEPDQCPSYWNGKCGHEPGPSVALCIIRLRLYAPISLSVSFLYFVFIY